MSKVTINPTTWWSRTREHLPFDVDIDTFITETLTTEHQRAVVETCFNQSINARDFVNRLKAETETGNILRVKELYVEQEFSSANTYSHAFYIRGENLPDSGLKPRP